MEGPKMANRVVYPLLKIGTENFKWLLTFWWYDGLGQMILSGLTWPDLTWPNLTWPDLTWSDLIWSDLIWSDLTRLGLTFRWNDWLEKKANNDIGIDLVYHFGHFIRLDLNDLNDLTWPDLNWPDLACTYLLMARRTWETGRWWYLDWLGPPGRAFHPTWVQSSWTRRIFFPSVNKARYKGL